MYIHVSWCQINVWIWKTFEFENLNLNLTKDIEKWVERFLLQNCFSLIAAKLKDKKIYTIETNINRGIQKKSQFQSCSQINKTREV